MADMNAVLEELGCSKGEAVGLVLELMAECEQLRAARVRAEQELVEARRESWQVMRAVLERDERDAEFVRAAGRLWELAPRALCGVFGVEVIKADNPYGCNQYGEGWKEEHLGNSTKYEQTGFSGKVSKMLINKQDGNTVEVATKDKKPGKGAYPDASEKGLEKAAESAEAAKEKKVMQGLAAFEGLLNGVKKTFKNYEDKESLTTISFWENDIEYAKKKLAQITEPEEKAKWVKKIDSWFKEKANAVDSMLKKAEEKNKEKKAATIKLQQDFTAKKGELLTGLEAGIKKVEEALAAAKAQGDAFGELHLPTVLKGLKHWKEQVNNNNEVNANNFAKLKAHGEFALKALRKADSDIKVIQEEYTGTLGKAKEKKDVGIPAPIKKDDLPEVKGKSKGIKADLLKFPDNNGDAIFKLVQEVETAGDKAAAKVWSKLKESERNVITSYSGSLYSSINASFRADAPTPAAKRLERALKKMELGMDVQVTRCEGILGLAGVLPKDMSMHTKAGMEAVAEYLNKQAKEGNAVVRPNKAPMSTSLAKGAFGKNKIVRIIALPKGTKGGCIANYSNFKSEREFLVAPGTKTRIIGAEVDEYGTLFIREEATK